MAGFGLRNASNAFAGYNSGGLLEFKMVDSYATPTFAGDPIILNDTTGNAERGAVAPVDTDGNVVGFAVGFRYSGYVVANHTTTVVTGAVLIRGVKMDGVNENSATPILYAQLVNGVSAFETGV